MSPAAEGTEAPAVSVIVPAFQAEETIGRTLEALRSQSLERSYEVLVVDDRSRDRTGEIARAAGPDIRLVEGPGSGPGAARNAGAAVARAPVLAFTDADCFPEPDWLAGGLAAIEAADVVQGLVRAEGGGAGAGPWDRTLWVLADDGLYQTANLFIRRETFQGVGGFEDWAPAGSEGRPPIGEDVDLVWRARRQGARATFEPDAVVEHAIFPRSPWGYVRERLRLRHFPALVRRVPELRRELLFARLFLTRRSAAFDLAIAGLIGLPLRRRLRILAALLPYTLLLTADARRRGWRHARVQLAADAVGCISLARGSLEARSPLL